MFEPLGVLRSLCWGEGAILDTPCVLSRLRLFAALWTVVHQAPCPWNFQTRILKQVAISSSRGSCRPRDGTSVSGISCTDRQVVYGTTWEVLSHAVVSDSLQPRGL